MSSDDNYEHELITHLARGHGFDLPSESPGVPGLEDIHDDLHSQEIRYNLPTHPHRWEAYRLTDDEILGVWDDETEAFFQLDQHFGSEAGKEWAVRKHIERPT